MIARLSPSQTAMILRAYSKRGSVRSARVSDPAETADRKVSPSVLG